MVFGNKKKPFVLKTREERERDIMETERLRARARPPKSPVKPIVRTGKTIVSKTKVVFRSKGKTIEPMPAEERKKQIKYELGKDKLETRHKKELEVLNRKYRTKKKGQIKKGQSVTFQEERNALLRRQSLEIEQFELEKK